MTTPTHGSQQLTLFHAFYEQYQYLPLVITCAENDAIVVLSLRHGTAPASLGADDDLEYLVTRISRGLAQRANPRAWRRRVRQPDHVRRERAARCHLHLRPRDQRGVPTRREE